MNKGGRPTTVGLPHCAMIKTFALPLSGPILSHLIEALDLRRLDHWETLTKRNSRRYLAGERVSPEAEVDVHAAVAKAIAESHLLPLDLVAADMVEGAGSVPTEVLGELTMPRLLQRFITALALHWDGLAGAVRRLSAPVAFPTQAAGACLRLVAVDVAVRLTALLWLSRTDVAEPLADFWCDARGTSPWLRSLHETCRPPLSRDALAKLVRVHEHTLDGWLDAEVRPTDENLLDLAHCFADRGLGTQDALVHRLRLAFAARALFKKVTAIVGETEAVRIGARIVTYANQMLRFPRSSKKSRAESDTKMRLTLMYGTLGRGELAMPWVKSMLNHLWRHEEDPVWRTTLKAATSGWFEHLQYITTKLGPIDDAEFLANFGSVPPREVLEQIAYMALATKEEMARNPAFAAAMDLEAQKPGRYGALEQKIRAGELVQRGDLLQAIELFREATARDPLDAEIHFRLGCCLWQVGDVAAGLTELEIAVQLKPSWDRARVEIAIVLLNEGRAEEAVRGLEEGRKALSTPSGWLLVNLAYAYERTSTLSDAILTYEALLLIEPDHGEALDRLAHLYFVTKERRKGADAAKRAARLGIHTVFRAWEAGFYDKGMPAERPRHTGLDALLHFLDGPLPRKPAPAR